MEEHYYQKIEDPQEEGTKVSREVSQRLKWIVVGVLLAVTSVACVSSITQNSRQVPILRNLLSDEQAHTPDTSGPTPPGPGPNDPSPPGPGPKDPSPPGPGPKDTSPPGPGSKDPCPPGTDPKDPSPPGPGKKDPSPPGPGPKKDPRPPGPGLKKDPRNSYFNE